MSKIDHYLLCTQEMSIQDYGEEKLLSKDIKGGNRKFESLKRNFIFIIFLFYSSKRRRVAYYWMPSLKSTVLYSEILDKHMKMIVTERALRLIDENYGLDNYLLNV